VIVTGGTGALGTAVVTALVAAGAHCHVPCRSEQGAAQSGLRDHPQVTLSAYGDLSEEAVVARLFAGVPHLWGSIHVAGGFAAAPTSETAKPDLMRQLEMNFISTFLCCGAAVKAMMKNGSGGRIVNVAARPALEWRSGAGMTAYTASKAAVAAMTVALAEEVAKHDILVNAVAPSILDTPANRSAMPKANHAGWPKVEEVAATILFLASPDNMVTRGAIVPVYGKA
jgi:NAD(P)-dependent dehydrogenase (short-subunit alcohol dehydrogenase family)